VLDYFGVTKKLTVNTLSISALDVYYRWLIINVRSIITELARHSLLQAIVNKKKIFYGMQVKTLRRKFADIRNRLAAVKDHLMEPYVDRIRMLYSTFKEVQV
jgi:hypothetical protein